MINELGRQARAAGRVLAGLNGQTKRVLLLSMADEVQQRVSPILSANADDMAQARSEGVSGALLDRLLLTEDRVRAMADGLRSVAHLPDPVGMITGGWTLANGIRLKRVRVPLGVIAVIYEARPNVTADAAGLCLKSGNAALLRGSSYALRSNTAIGAALQVALVSHGLPADAVQVMEDTSREAAKALMQAKEWVDLLVPRGGPGLIAAIEADATVPFVIDGAGNCHVYVDAAADLTMAGEIVFNSKVQRPGVCNAAESLVVHEAVAEEFLPGMARRLSEAGVELRGDESARALASEMVPAGEEDWGTEYHDLIMSVRIVGDLDEAIDHILTYGTGHTEAIITNDVLAAARFTREIDAAAVMVNASTRFTDGEQFGFGAEIGISTQKLHVRGPMGLEALTSERYILFGDGQVRE
ncbi:MAG: glutamate-5-semialdehyde dehydrogenase [Acidimicrobiia bacterium]